MPAEPMEHGSDQTPFQVFMSSFWNEASDLYLGKFENALNRFLQYADKEQRRDFLSELEAVGRKGFVEDITSPEAVAYWGSLGDRALSKQEYMTALRIVSGSV